MRSVKENENRQLTLLRLMRQHGVTNKKLAQVIDRSRETVARYRSGEAPIPDHTLALIELALRYRPESFQREESMSKYSDKVKEQAVQMLASGSKQADVSAALGVSQSKISAWSQQAFGKNNCFGEGNWLSRHSDEDVELARTLYEEGIGPSEIARKLEVPLSTVESWVSYRMRTGSRTYYAERRQAKREAE